MPEWFVSLGPVGQALLGTLGTYLLTVLGTLPVFFFRDAPRRLLDALLGFSGGVMIAASCWSLLQPALDRGGVLPAVVGLLVGGAFLGLLDHWLPELEEFFKEDSSREAPAGWHRAVLLMVAITIHNFPEGLAVGVAYASGSIGAATALALGIALQNIPEGLAIALPLRREGMGRGKAFFYGQASASIEPVAGVLGAGLVIAISAALPYGMAFAAGAMLYVVVRELIPETVKSGSIGVATAGFLVGFAVMMALDNAFK